MRSLPPQGRSTMVEYNGWPKTAATATAVPHQSQNVSNALTPTLVPTPTAIIPISIPTAPLSTPIPILTRMPVLTMIPILVMIPIRISIPTVVSPFRLGGN